MISHCQSRSQQPDAPESSPTSEHHSLNTGTSSSSPTRRRVLPRNAHLHPQPFHQSPQPKPSSPTPELQPQNNTASPSTRQRPPLPRNAHLHPQPFRQSQRPENPENSDNSDNSANTISEQPKDALENCYHVITTASIITAAFVIALFILSFTVAVHLEASTRALSTFNERAEQGRWVTEVVVGTRVEEEGKAVDTVTETHTVVVDRVETTITQVQTVTVTEKEEIMVTTTEHGVVSTATELVIFVSDT